MTDRLTRLIGFNTYSYNCLGLAAFSKYLTRTLDSLGEDLRFISLPPYALRANTGDIELHPLGNAISLRAKNFAARTGPRVLLGIHYDTVFPKSHPFQHVFLPDPQTLRGPGVADAKGGLVILLFALQALERSPYAKNIRWQILLNPDEEIGSPGSAHLWREAAKHHDLALLFEPALPDGALVSARKGSANYTLLLHGKSAHAGRDFAAGRNAIHALAPLITRLATLPEKIPGIQVNVGFLSAGGPVNIIPDRALARINIRIETAGQQLALDTELAALQSAPLPEGITLALTRDIHSPPKPLTKKTESLLHAFKNCADQLNIPLTWRPTGGTCDGNRTAAAGLPTLDSLGPRGDHLHTDREFIHIDSLAERAKLTALFLMQLAAGQIQLPN